MIKVVVGLGFGDEGKGLTTSYLCHENSIDAVVRFNGGQQAGHTVVYDGVRHVFSNFGSGTLQEVPTYWHKYCTFHPTGVVNEFNSLKGKGFSPSLIVHPLCPVTTPYDILHNQQTSRRTNHGSVGVGFGSTLQRQENFYKLFVQDLFYKDVLREKLKNIAFYYGFEIDEMFENFLEDVEKCKEIIQVENENFLSFKNLVFEGAQGILLDQDFGFFPNVTRSNTTSKNALEIISSLYNTESNIEIVYVTRSYQTRHGNGFMTNEDSDFPLKNNENETNVSHPFQGEFRKGKLDLELIKYALDCDDHFSRGLKKSLMVTCTDQTEINLKSLKILLSKKQEFEKIFYSNGPSFNNVQIL